MPERILVAYTAYLEYMLVHNCLAGGVGTPYWRKCGIPQGCPFSMCMVALIMRPWIIVMRTITTINAYILADDVLMMATGDRMTDHLAKAIDKTHAFLHDLGARVAPDKSYNFASTVAANKWLADTWWEGIGAKIEVVKDFRYLGAHLSSGRTCISSTLQKRWERAYVQLKKLRYIPATTRAKLAAIRTKVFAAAMYGVEAAEIAPAKMASMSAAVIDVFKSKNDNHNADRFYTTIALDKDETDPMIEVFARRLMQIRRTTCKNIGMETRYKDMLRRYADKHMKGQEWPKWYQQTNDEANSKEGRPSIYPVEQPHPSTDQHQADWREDLEPYGPVGS